MRTNYRLRVASFLMAFVALGMDLYTRDTGARLWTLLALQFLVYPHLLYWRARHARDAQKAELDHLLLDSLMLGMWVAALHFPLWPTFTLWLGCSLNITMTSGLKGTLRSLLAFILGVLIAVSAFGFEFVPDTVWPTTALAILGTAAYLIAIGNTSHQRNRQLRATREKLRDREHVLQQQLAEIQVLQDQLKDQAVHDPLTGLFNRRYLDTIVPHELARCARERIPLCLMMMDIDHFKRVNDTYGHQGGDAVLNALAALLSDSVRASDVACRYGGEEFLLLLPNMPVANALLRAEEWLAAVAAMTVAFAGKDIQVTISIGIASYPEDGNSGEELTRSADLALYRAKAEGRDRVVLFSAEMAPV
ncbi:MAG: diguanylate cyclase [Pseudomonadota bacterium]